MQCAFKTTAFAILLSNSYVIQLKYAGALNIQLQLPINCVCGFSEDLNVQLPEHVIERPLDAHLDALLINDHLHKSDEQLRQILQLLNKYNNR